MQLFAEVNKRFRVPEGGGRATDTAWIERRLLPLRPQTLKRLQKISNSIQKHQHVSIEPMQLAALLVEKTTEELTEEEVEKLVTASRTIWSGQNVRTRDVLLLPDLCLADVVVTKLFRHTG